MFGWIHFIDSKETYEKLWNNLIKNDDLMLGSFIVIEGSLTCKNGRVIGKKGEIIAGITSGTFTKESMEKIFESKMIDSSITILIDDLSPEELVMDDESESMIKKIIKSFEKPSDFENYLEKIHYKNFV